MKERHDDTISINPYLTAKLSHEELDNLKQNSGGLDPYTGLESPTKLGRPDFGAIFEELKVVHAGESMFLIPYQVILSLTLQNSL
jgi:hypothetical protein